MLLLRNDILFHNLNASKKNIKIHFILYLYKINNQKVCKIRKFLIDKLLFELLNRRELADIIFLVRGIELLLY